MLPDRTPWAEPQVLIIPGEGIGCFAHGPNAAGGGGIISGGMHIILRNFSSGSASSRVNIDGSGRAETPPEPSINLA